MWIVRVVFTIAILFSVLLTCSYAAEPEDSWLWLEDVGGARSLDWVKAQNVVSTKELEADAFFEPVRKRILDALDSKEKIPYVAKHGKWVYNFWQDKEHQRGIWRRTTPESYRSANPVWETVLDLDKLAAEEKENWVWKGADVLFPSCDRALLQLSRGGADAVVIREFNLLTISFVDAGFCLPEAKTDVAWLDMNTIYVATDFGPGSLTTSGYPRLVKEWSRGQKLAEAKQAFEAWTNDVRAIISVIHDHGRRYDFVGRVPTFFSSEMYIRTGDRLARIEKQPDAELSLHNGQLLFQLRSDWKVQGTNFVSGSLVSAPVDDFISGKGRLTALYTPTERGCLTEISQTRSWLVLNVLENVRSSLHLLQINGGKWTHSTLDTPTFGTVEFSGVDRHESDEYFMIATSFLTPTTLHWGTIGRNDRVMIKSLPAFFNAEGIEVRQHEAVSKDGTRVPFFVVCRTNLPLSGDNPTLLYGYGGFEIPMLPAYNAALGAGWLETGGVYVLANIRGGGEFGPKWHQAALRQNRQKAYDDFSAVAEEIIRLKVTSPQRLGIQGGSNGGLLVGVMLTQRPELFRAVVCQVPLLDMRRYNQLLAGASWMDEYGNPDNPDEWKFIRKYSPYQNLSKDRKYPRVLFTTSTRDDRVHPAHARKMVARMVEQGHDVLYYENIEGGHGGAANNRQSAYMRALGYAFLWRELTPKGKTNF